MGGVASGFQFLSYKIDTFHFDARQDASYLGHGHEFDPQKVHISFAFRQPVFDTNTGMYMGGLEARIEHPAEQEGQDCLFQLNLGLEGLFQAVEESRFDPQTEKDLVRYQIPAILFPYLRSAVTSFFASAGLGSFVFPLVNVREMAKQAEQNLEIQVIE